MQYQKINAKDKMMLYEKNCCRICGFQVELRRLSQNADFYICENCGSLLNLVTEPTFDKIPLLKYKGVFKVTPVFLTGIIWDECSDYSVSSKRVCLIRNKGQEDFGFEKAITNSGREVQVEELSWNGDISAAACNLNYHNILILDDILSYREKPLDDLRTISQSLNTGDFLAVNYWRYPSASICVRVMQGKIESGIRNFFSDKWLGSFATKYFEIIRKCDYGNGYSHLLDLVGSSRNDEVYKLLESMNQKIQTVFDEAGLADRSFVLCRLK